MRLIRTVLRGMGGMPGTHTGMGGMPGTHSGMGGYPGVYARIQDGRLPWCICPYTMVGRYTLLYMSHPTTLGIPPSHPAPVPQYTWVRAVPGREALGSEKRIIMVNSRYSCLSAQ